ncbi:hypothetical protein [Perigonia lusca single nucleopolyhedrovirus]|uniref:Uncharacterized protein n=1 Tax=Perigonia lusca single nucleopolyhedrovirus TaxID=1675865 RepID=A0A0M3WN50_9ABAC|nr:hypothetical protein [Perigonia lusca single nucleopolyhedrovirus]AKN80675.1 hypothetical protein [Perigonia lusca single nucleopolyhedrovirus]
MTGGRRNNDNSFDAHYRYNNSNSRLDTILQQHEIMRSEIRGIRSQLYDLCRNAVGVNSNLCNRIASNNSAYTTQPLFNQATAFEYTGYPTTTTTTAEVVKTKTGNNDTNVYYSNAIKLEPLN